MREPTAAVVARRRRLTVMRRRATLLLVAVTVVFVVASVAGDGTVAAYVQATAEGSMVGALADWFAVTALFRRPLGLPIPHTAVVVARKDQFAGVLGDFVQHDLLTPASVAERVQALDPVGRGLDWLQEPANANRLAGQLARGAARAADMVEDDAVHDAVGTVLRSEADAVALAPLAGRALAGLTAGGRHEAVLDTAFRWLDRYLDEHGQDLRHRFVASAPWWLPGTVSTRMFERTLDSIRSTVWALGTDRTSSLRRSLEASLDRFAVELQESPELRRKGEDLKRQLLAQPEVRQLAGSVLTDLRRELHEQAASPDSTLRLRLGTAVSGVAARVAADPELRARADAAVTEAVTTVVSRHHDEIAGLVASTVAGWDASEAADRLELLLGPDLQFIRINGTVIGALAGFALHAAARALG